MAPATIHITVDLEAVVRAKLRELSRDQAITSAKLYQAGFRAALEWLLEEAGLTTTTTPHRGHR